MTDQQAGTAPGPAGPGAACPGPPAGGHADAIDVEILESLGEMMGAMLREAEQVAQRFGMPAFGLKALHMLDRPLAMKELGRRMHCDPSFVTAIADLLEKRGLAARESDPADRRVKRLALTPAGLTLREQAEREFLALMPWRRALGLPERRCLLGHVRKLAPALTGQAASLFRAKGGADPEEVSGTMAAGPAAAATDS